MVTSWTLSLDRASLATACFVVFLGVKYVNAYRERSKLDAVPTSGPDGILSSYYTVWRYVFRSSEVLEEGCRKYPDRVFKIPTFDGWKVFVHGKKLVNDVRRASEEELSIMDAFEDILKARYTISPMIHTNPYHVEVIRTPLTRNINVRFDDIRDEIIAAFSDHITTQNHEWAELPTAETARKIVVRTSNRLFVGLPLCRDPDFCDLNIQFTINVAVNSIIISFFPSFLHPIVGRVFTKRNESMRRALRHLAPVIEERLRMHDEHGSEWASRPNDYISWLIEATEYQAEDWQKGSVEDLTLRILAVNFAAIHTTSMALTFALHNLAANPHHAEPLRREVEMVVGQEGWTKGAMVKLRLMDSFLKESQRPNGGSTMINRKAKKDFKFSDGTIVPAGTHISVATEFTHCNEATYPDPNGFNATRFSDLRDKEGEGLKHQMVTPTPDWLSFGTGKHACPGRFFAVSEIKAMLAHVLLNYDVKFKDDAPCPPAMNIAGNAGPDENAKVMFRKRINTSTL